MLSDTHLSHGEEADDLFKDLAGYFRAADLIIHAGDHTGIDFYHGLEQMGNLVSVCGNMDALSLRADLPDRITFEREGVHIGVMHGWGPARGLPERIYHAWTGDKPDVIIFGHSHQTYQQRQGKTLLFNPGSPIAPCGPYPTVGWLEIEKDQSRAGHVTLPKNGEFP